MEVNVGVGVSLFLLAVGAILVWAVNATVAGVSIVTVGWILMAVGFIGLLLFLLFWGSNSPLHRSRESYYDH